MTKRILALALVAVFACFALASCIDETPKTTTPAGTTTVAPGTTKAPETTKAPATTTAPVTTTVDNTTPTPAPTTTPADTEEEGFDMFARFGGIEKLLAGGSFYAAPFETWPFIGNTQWCPRAFFQACLTLTPDDGDYTQNIGTDDYEYTWKWYYYDAEIVPESEDDIHGPYTSPTETFYKFESGNVIYRLQVGSAPEGDMCAEFEVGKTYSFLVGVYKGDTCVGFVYDSTLWDAKCDAYHKAYTNFWTAHDRSEGYAAGMQTLTDADTSYATELGFDAEGKYVG